MALDERFYGLSVAEVLEARAAEDPDRTFLIFNDRRWTYRQVDARASALAAALRELGIEPGDRIALDLPNWPEFVISVFAAAGPPTRVVVRPRPEAYEGFGVALQSDPPREGWRPSGTVMR